MVYIEHIHAHEGTRNIAVCNDENVKTLCSVFDYRLIRVQNAICKGQAIQLAVYKSTICTYLKTSISNGMFQCQKNTLTLNGTCSHRYTSITLK